MPKIQFTKLKIEALSYDPVKGPVDYFDTGTTGLGLRVGKETKTFFAKTEVRDPSKPSGYRTVRKVLGRFGEITLEQAQKELTGYDDREAGFVPGARLAIKRGKTKSYGSDLTLEQMLEAYFQEKRTSEGRDYKPSTIRGYTRCTASWTTRGLKNWHAPMAISAV